MAGNTEKKILVSVEILDNFISAKKNLEEWKKKLKEAEQTGNATAEELRTLTQNVAKANQQYQLANKTLTNTTRTQEVLNTTTDRTNQSLGDMQRELTTLRNAPLENLGSEAVEEINEKIVELSGSIKNYKIELQGMDTGGVFANTAEGLQTVVAGVSALSSTLGALGVENEAVEKLNEHTTQLIATVQALGVVTDYLQKSKYKLIAANIRNIALNIQETIAKKLNTIQTYNQANAENLSTGAKIKGAIATKALTLAQWLWNAAMAANPIFLVIAAIALLVTGIALLTTYLNKESDAQREVTKANEAYEKQVKKTQHTLDLIENKRLSQSESAKLRGRQELQELKNNGASKEALAKKEFEIASQVRDIEVVASNAIIKAKTEEVKSLLILIESKKKELAEERKGTKAYNEKKEAIQELVKAHENLINVINTNYFKVQNLMQDQIEEEQNLKKQSIEIAKDRATKAFDNLNKSLDAQKKFNEAQIKAELDYQSNDYLTKVKYTRRLFELNQKTETDKLSLQKKHGKITQQEYEKQLAILNAQQTEFNNSQSKGLQDYYKEQRKSLFDMVNKDVDAQIKEVQERYQKALDNYSMPEPKRKVGQSDESFTKELEQYRQFMFEKTQIEMKFKEQAAKEIVLIQETSLAKQISDIEKKVSDSYKNDLAKHSDNERVKNKIEIEALEELIKKKKEANLSVYEEEVKLREANNKAIVISYNTELLIAGQNAEAKYKVRKSYLEQELEIYRDNADKIIEINAQLAENDRELLEARIASFDEWANRTTQLFGSMSDFMGAKDSEELQRYESENEQKKAILEQRLESGAISQEEYDRQVADADAKLDKKRKELAQKQAIREKSMKIFEIGINTASGIMKASPNIPLMAMVGSTGALQMATVIATPLPKAARGAFLRGNSHAQGGIAIEAEGGEAIINKRSVSMFGPLLSAINQAGGGIPFSTPYSDGGYMSRSAIRSNSMSKDEMKEAMSEAVQDIKVYTTIEDIRRENKNYTTIENRGRY